MPSRYSSAVRHRTGMCDERQRRPATLTPKLDANAGLGQVVVKRTPDAAWSIRMPDPDVSRAVI